MKRFLFITIITLALVGCAPVASQPTVDPYVGLALAEAQGEVYAGQLTGTAQAWSMQQTAWTATAQSWTPTPSSTPVPTSTPTISPTPTVNVTGTMAVEYMNAELADMQREAKRKEATNTVLAWLPYLAFGLALGLAVFFGYVGARRLAMVPTPIHEGTGKPLPLLNVIDAVVVDVDRMTNGAGQVNGKYIKSLPLITAERQDAVTAMAQAVDMKSRSKVTSEAVRKLLESQQLALGNQQPGVSGQLPAVSGLFESDFQLPTWEKVREWDGTGLPYGVHADGRFGTIDLNRNPHTAVFGETGSGKSRRFLRPLITFALAQGHRVVILGKQVDFMPFAGHPNVTILPVRELTLADEAVKYARFLKSAVDEMGRRDAWLSSVHKSTWAQAGRESILLVFDEYTNAMDLMPRQFAEDARRYTKGLLREGRKYGFSMVISAQRAVGLRDEVTQLGRAVFHVADQQESRFAIGVPGAEVLRDGYFMAKFGAMCMAGAFEPTDDQIAAFLADRQPRSLEPLPWLDGHVIEPTEDAPKIEAPKSDVEKLAETIRDRWNPEMSGRQVAALLGKGYAGWWKNKTDEIIAVLKNKNLEGVNA